MFWTDASVPGAASMEGRDSEGGGREHQVGRRLTSTMHWVCSFVCTDAQLLCLARAHPQSSEAFEAVRLQVSDFCVAMKDQVMEVIQSAWQAEESNRVSRLTPPLVSR